MGQNQKILDLTPSTVIQFLQPVQDNWLNIISLALCMHTSPLSNRFLYFPLFIDCTPPFQKLFLLIFSVVENQTKANQAKQLPSILSIPNHSSRASSQGRYTLRTFSKDFIKTGTRYWLTYIALLINRLGEFLKGIFIERRDITFNSALHKLGENYHTSRNAV